MHHHMPGFFTNLVMMEDIALCVYFCRLGPVASLGKFKKGWAFTVINSWRLSFLQLFIYWNFCLLSFFPHQSELRQHVESKRVIKASDRRSSVTSVNCSLPTGILHSFARKKSWFVGGFVSPNFVAITVRGLYVLEVRIEWLVYVFVT